MTQLDTPSDWDSPVFLVNFPLSVSNVEPNNPWMRPWEQGTYDKSKACDQWMEVYRILAKESLVYILPGHNDLQDLPFVANLGAFLPHSQSVLLSNYTSQPRVKEYEVGLNFFKSFSSYKVEQVPFKWEGEADLKWIRNNIYVGGIGMRSTSEAFQWMRDTYSMHVTEIELKDPSLYHLDCVFFPLTDKKAVVNINALTRQDVAKLEKITEIIEVPEGYMYQGWTNCVRLHKKILHAPPGMTLWHPFADLLEKHGFQLEVFDLSEFEKSGADLSCLVMHLNEQNRA